MFEKAEILVVIFALLITFYLVISIGAGKKRKSFQSREIISYLFSISYLFFLK